MKKGTVKGLCLGLSAIMFMGIGSPMTVEAAKKKPAVKKVQVIVGGKAVNSKTLTVKKGSTVKVAVRVTPSNAKKSISYKTSNKKVASVSKGKIKAKKAGTAKLTIKVKGKNGKSKSVWFKFKVVNKLPAKKPATKPAVPSKPATKPSTPSKPAVKPEEPSKPVVKPVEPVDPKPEEPSIPSKPEVDWKTCSHDWGVGCKHQEMRSICSNCNRDYEDIYHHQDVEFEKDWNTECQRFGTHLVSFWECSKCGAGKKFIPSWTDVNTGTDLIFQTYEECLQYTPY